MTPAFHAMPKQDDFLEAQSPGKWVAQGTGKTEAIRPPAQPASGLKPRYDFLRTGTRTTSPPGEVM
jgi:hypothetical protein